MYVKESTALPNLAEPSTLDDLATSKVSTSPTLGHWLEAVAVLLGMIVVGYVQNNSY